MVWTCRAVSFAFVSLAWPAAADDTQPYPEPEICRAVVERDIEGIGILARAGQDIEAPCAFGGTPLSYAVRYENVPAARALLEAGADVNARTDRFGTALMTAAGTGQLEMVRLLIKAGADANSAMPYATVLMSAINSGSQEIVQALIHGGANVNAVHQDTTALAWAVRHGQTAIIRQLVAAGANINFKEPATGDTALRDAAAMSNNDVVRVFLDEGADVNLTNRFGGTALMEAAIGPVRGTIAQRWKAEAGGRLATVQTLIDAGADINAKDMFGKTALMHAKKARHDKVVQLLIEAGAERKD